MADIYATLMGEPPTDQEKLNALARQLRERNKTGLLGSMMSNPNISKTGANLMQTADAQAKFMGDQGEQARYRKYQEDVAKANQEAAAREQAWKEANAEAERKHDVAMELLNQRGQMALEGVRQSGKVSDEAKLDAKERKLIDSEAIKYGKNLEAVGIPVMRTAIGNVNKLLSNYEGKNIPGINPMGGLTALATSEGRQMRTALQPITNIMLKLRSGAAVSPKEADRLEAEMFGAGATDASFRQAWQQVQDLVAAQEANVNKSYDPRVLETYAGRSGKGGISAPDAPAATGAPSPEGLLTPEQWKARKAGRR